MKMLKIILLLFISLFIIINKNEVWADAYSDYNAKILEYASDGSFSSSEVSDLISVRKRGRYISIHGSDAGYWGAGKASDTTYEIIGGRIVITCNNGVTRIIKNCSCQDWTSERSDCDSSGYPLVINNGICSKKCKETLIWTSTTKLGSQECDEDGSNCGVCTISCNPKGADATIENTIKWNCPIACGSANGKNYTYDIEDWPTGETFCNLNPQPYVGFPNKGEGVNWTCSYNGDSVPCNASRGTGTISNLPECGTANSHMYGETDNNWQGRTFCNSISTPSPSESYLDDNFIEKGGTTYWLCTNSKGQVPCSADRQGTDSNGPVCGTADGHIYKATDGGWLGRTWCESPSNVDGVNPNFPNPGDRVEWDCERGGYTKHCSSERLSIGSVIPECGTADGYTYKITDGGWLGRTWCKPLSTVVGTNPNFPNPGDRVEWFCKRGSVAIKCESDRLDNGSDIAECGTANEHTYNASDTGWLGRTWCISPSIVSGLNPSFPGRGSETYWVCRNGTATKQCYANRKSISPYGKCGDLVIQKPNFNGDEETCELNELGCRSSNCTKCGDGLKQPLNGEDCDDGNSDNNDKCSNSCKFQHTSWPSSAGTCTFESGKYANNSDTNDIYAYVTVDGNLNGKTVINLGKPTNIKDLSGHVSDKINNSGGTPLTFTGVNIIRDATQGPNQKVLIARVSSVTPLQSNNSTISLELGGKIFTINNVCYNFNKPYTGKLEASNNNGKKRDFKPSIGTKLRYKLSAISYSPTTFSKNYKLSLLDTNISHLGANIVTQATRLLGYSGELSRDFETRINSSSNASTLNKFPGIVVSNSVISYVLGGKNVSYYLSQSAGPNDQPIVEFNGEGFIGVKIIGGLQGGGKSTFTGQDKNISNLYPSNLRTEIRKRAYDYIKSMKNGEKINDVKFVEGNITISGSLSYETLIVKNGNVIISGNLNVVNNKKLGIIVLRDNYDVNDGYKGFGNVLVKPNVRIINAMIYADGGLISSDMNGKVYDKDDLSRTSSLQNQLYMYGVLFTRNTIGGAQYVGGFYTLPGGNKIYGTDGFNRAMVYDLNYIRRGNLGCNKNSDTDCDDTALGEYTEGFIIKYDSKIQTDPPKLFSK